ncbi:C40 family peptidase [Paenibacillus tarimensis]
MYKFKNIILKTSALAIAFALMFTGSFTGTADAYHNSDKSMLNSDNLSQESKTRLKTVIYGREYLGTPYEFGAKYGQTRTMDCSSFTKTVFARIGIKLPRVSRDQAREGRYVSKSNLKVGDLVFFSTSSRVNKKGIQKIGHVGIYVGHGMMIHTFGKGGVKYNSIVSGWWDDHYITARRIIGN